MADNILHTIAEYAKVRVSEAKKKIPEELLKEQTLSLCEKQPLSGFPFEAALAKEGMSFICECKKAFRSFREVCS